MVHRLLFTHDMTVALYIRYVQDADDLSSLPVNEDGTIMKSWLDDEYGHEHVPSSGCLVWMLKQQYPEIRFLWSIWADISGAHRIPRVAIYFPDLSTMTQFQLVEGVRHMPMDGDVLPEERL